ncbi:DUF4145 domain-containing protein [Marinilactibacillus psychrotolerans]|uniref:DUF4145 domain-containing protein n=1 Tax=Marinilactibacillus psychrotolerans TaxID=191770 RepID=A0AAV3WWF8_9LACT|nr:DUF4145 domain-containing protein [Marinilactibacillus psychrotolerans]GEL67235.1 hypothetical protein MPS01_13900 [Marinilactibacillus psychrotolerans]GEQ36039.1 hypothetical protein M132T_15470 [Marinilactibacillus psychrotolerans]SDC60954.1 protein of unknown function [Marinilactibacillus psychrotolerans]
MNYNKYQTRFFLKSEQTTFVEEILIQNPLICQHCRNTGPQVLVEAVGTLGDNDRYNVISITACSLCGSNSVHYCYALPKEIDYTGEGDKPNKFNIAVSYPKTLSTHELPNKLTERYHRFVKVYKQAQLAEEEDLDELAGMGYRKAIEILLTDYLLEHTPENVESEWLTNPKTTLGNKINVLPSERIKGLAKTISFIGNDETHYTRIHDDQDINSLKVFAKSLISEIDHELVLSESQSFLENVFSKKSKNQDN